MRSIGVWLSGIALAALGGTAGVWATDAIDGSTVSLSSLPDGHFRTAAIHPTRPHGAVGRNGQPGHDPLALPITRNYAAPPRFAKITVAPNGLLVASGTGRAGQPIRLLHNNRQVAAVRVGDNRTWRIMPKALLAAGDHTLSLETEERTRGDKVIGGEIRVSIPPGFSDPIAIEFDDPPAAEDLQAERRYAESVGEAASSFFDDLLKKKAIPQDRVAQARGDLQSNDDTVDGTMLDSAWSWLGNSNEAYQREIVPRLQIGGGLSLPGPDERRPVVTGAQAGGLESLTIEGITTSLQSWFGGSADNYDREILPRLSGARPPRIVLRETDRREETKVDTREDELAEQRRAEEEQRRAEEERRRAEAERIRAEEERRQAEAERLRLEEERQADLREQAERERAAAEEQARLDAERLAQEDRARQERERELAEEERLRAERAAELAQAEREEELRRAEEQRRLAEEQRRLAEENRQREADRVAREQRDRAERGEQEIALAPPLPVQQERSNVDSERAGDDAARQAPERSTFSSLWRRARRTFRRIRPKNQDDDGQVVAVLPERRPFTNYVQPPPVELDRGDDVAVVRPAPRRVAAVVTRTKRRRATKKRAWKRRAKAVRRPKRRVARKVHRRRAAHYRCKTRSGRRVRLPGKYTVRKGDSLWRIARRHYRRGHRYKRIFKANRHRIKNPHLIYPCQRFYIPRRLARRGR